MAFIRIEKKKSGNYIRVMESYREHGKSKHKILASLGKESDYTPDMLKRMGEKLYLLGGGELKDLLKKETKELGRYNYGYYQATLKALQHFNLDAYFRAYLKKSRISFDLFNTLHLLIAERLEEPGSKLCNFNIQKDYIGFQEVNLHHIYRALDHLCKLEDNLQVFLYQQEKNLFNQKLDVVFYDVTTFYFDSVHEDDFRQKGFGKDGKVGKTQIVFGLLIDKEKNPIGYQVYEGKKYEGHTLKDAVKGLKSKYQIDDVIVVADRGMLSKSNIDIVKEENFEFIVGERLKSLPNSVKNEILDLSKYQHEW
ncbi:IS1634 family transposase, partial [Flammeovirga aprica]